MSPTTPENILAPAVKRVKREDFPCPYCKGEGTWIEVVIPETGEGPTESCGVCNGTGFIGINSPEHRSIQYNHITEYCMTAFDKDEDWFLLTDEDQDVFFKALADKIKEIEQLFIDNRNNPRRTTIINGTRYTASTPNVIGEPIK